MHPGSETTPPSGHRGPGPAGGSSSATDPRPFISADIGGTHARVALVQGTAEGGVSVLRHVRHECAAYPSLAAVLREFAIDSGAAPTRAVVAIAGLVDGDAVVAANLPWPVSIERTRSEAGLVHLGMVNDFEAVAHATPYIDPATATRLSGPEQAQPGPVLVLGPGTGFGAALRLPGPPAMALPIEAGHAALGAGTSREIELLRHLRRRWPHVDNERVLSGPGLVNAYVALCEIDGVAPRLDAPETIAAAAQTGDDAQAREALQVFCGLLGSLAGDLAVTLGARAVYLAGGIPARIRPFLLGSDFAARFRNKGVLADMLARVPVWLVDHGQLGLVGAAAWYRERHPAA